MTPTTKKSTAVATSEKNEVAVFDPTALLEENSGNSEIVRPENCSLPYLQIAETISDVCKARSDKHIEGITPGDVYNSVTKEFFSELFVIPCQIKKSVVAWTDEPKGKPQGTYEVNHPYVTGAKWKDGNNGSKKLVAEDGCVLVETMTFLVKYFTADGKSGTALLPMSKSRLKTAKDWNSMIISVLEETSAGKKFNPKAYMQVYRLTTVEREYNGNTWFVYDIKYNGLVPSEQLMEAAKSLFESDIQVVPEESANVGVAMDEDDVPSVV